MKFKPLIDALNSTNKPVCIKMAAKLLKSNQSSYDLHLRSADLIVDDVKLITKAIDTVHRQGGPKLHSFSMSYNTELKDEGVLELVKKLPNTVTEIGLVQCEISDQGGLALVNWAAKARQLHWLCVEQNSFSNQTKSKLLKLGEERTGLLVIV